MSKFDDDMARGCLPTGEPLECAYGVGWWTEMPEEEPEPEPELKPCPFCGNDDWYFEQGTEGETEIVCDRCEYRSQTFQTIEDAIKWWETRPIEDALQTRIAELEAENDELKERVAMLDVTAVYKSLGEMGYIEQVDRLNARIAELKDFIDQLIEVGHKSVNFVEGFCNTYGDERPKYWHDWKALVSDWKEREE